MRPYVTPRALGAPRACDDPGVDKDWVALNGLVLRGLKDGYSYDHPPATDQELEWLAATVTDHVIAGVLPRKPSALRKAITE